MELWAGSSISKCQCRGARRVFLVGLGWLVRPGWLGLGESQGYTYPAACSFLDSTHILEHTFHLSTVIFMHQRLSHCLTISSYIHSADLILIS